MQYYWQSHLCPLHVLISQQRVHIAKNSSTFFYIKCKPFIYIYEYFSNANLAPSSYLLWGVIVGEPAEFLVLISGSCSPILMFFIPIHKLVHFGLISMENVSLEDTVEELECVRPASTFLGRSMPSHSTIYDTTPSWFYLWFISVPESPVVFLAALRPISANIHCQEKFISNNT